MRVISVITRLNIGGASPPVIALAAGLKARGHQSLLVVGTPAPAEGTLETEARRAGADLVHIPELSRNPHPLKDPLAFLKLYRLFRHFKPDVVATHMSKAGALGRAAAKAAGVPVIVHTYHGKGFHVFDERWKERTALYLERLLASIDTGNIVVSTKQREEFLSLNVAPSSRLEVIRYGLDLDPLLRITETHRGLASELGVAPDVPLIGVIARLVTIKGQHVFLDAAAKLLQRGCKAHFVLAGDGEKREELVALARTLGIIDSVHFLGWRRDIPAVLAGLRIVVLPTVNDFEGTPLAVIEALAAGRAVVATDVGGVAEVVQPRETGLLVSPRDPDALADAMDEFLRDPAFAQRTAEQGRTLVRSLYQRERMVDETELYFRRLLSEQRPTREASVRAWN